MTVASRCAPSASTSDRGATAGQLLLGRSASGGRGQLDFDDSVGDARVEYRDRRSRVAQALPGFQVVDLLVQRRGDGGLTGSGADDAAGHHEGTGGRVLVG